MHREKSIEQRSNVAIRCAGRNYIAREVKVYQGTALEDTQTVPSRLGTAGRQVNVTGPLKALPLGAAEQCAIQVIADDCTEAGWRSGHCSCLTLGSVPLEALPLMTTGQEPRTVLLLAPDRHGTQRCR